MSKKRKAFTQEEIWDDSELIDSWNDALEEYKYYHSLHARGEKVQDVLRQAKETDSNPRTSANHAAEGELDPNELDLDMASSDGEIHEPHRNTDTGFQIPPPATPDDDTSADIKENHGKVAPSAQAQERPAPAPTPSAPAPGTEMPQVLSAVVGASNEPLKNLMMSWYYAGYYTGLYEGQQDKVEGNGHGHGHGSVGKEKENGDKKG